MNQKRFEFLDSFYSAHRIVFEKASQCFSSLEPASNIEITHDAIQNSLLRKPNFLLLQATPAKRSSSHILH